MTDAELAEIEARAAKATEAPWRADLLDDWADQTAVEGPGFVSGNLLPEHPTEDAQAQIHADATFIAHARADVPRMVGEIRRLRAMLSLTEQREAAERTSGARYSVALDKVAEIVSGVLTRLADAPERDSQTLSELHPVLEERDRAYSAS